MPYVVGNGTIAKHSYSTVSADGLRLALVVLPPANATHGGALVPSHAIALSESSTRVSVALSPSVVSSAAAVVVIATGVREAVRVVARRPAPRGCPCRLLNRRPPSSRCRLYSNGTLAAAAAVVPYFETSVAI